MSSRRFLVVLSFLFLPLFFARPISAQSMSLDSAPLGTVITINTTDTEFCTNANCSTTGATHNYKLIKMQPRGSSGAPTADSGKFSYWMMMENYCPWMSANCTDTDGQRNATGQAFNCTSASDCNRNYSVPKANTVLKVLGSFYNSLPSSIGGLSKVMAVKQNAAWDSLLVNSSGTKSGCDSAWTAGSSTPVSGVAFNFTAAASCNYTSQVGLVSADEWHGGLSGVANTPSGSGSGADFCQKLSGNANCSASNFTGTGMGNPNNPWLRSFDTATSVWSIAANGALTAAAPSTLRGVFPALWLNPLLCTNTGSGTFADPYTLTVGTCSSTPTPTNTAPTINITSPASSNNCAGANSFTATITDPDADTWTVSYRITQTATAPNDGWIAACTSATNKTCTAAINPSLAIGSYLHVRVFDGTSAGYTFFNCQSGSSSGGTSNNIPQVGISSPASGANCTADITSLGVRWDDPDNDNWTVSYGVTSSSSVPSSWTTLCTTNYLSQGSPRNCSGNISPPFNTTNKFLHVKVSDGRSESSVLTIECNNGTVGGTTSTPTPTPSASPSPSSSPKSNTSATSSASLPASGSLATLTISFLGCLILGFGAYYRRRHQLASPAPQRPSKKPASSYSDFDPYH